MAAVVFNDFSGGHWGELDPGKAGPTFFHAKNLLVYRNGALGPRPGLKLLKTLAAGPVYGIGYVEGVVNNRNLITVEANTIVSSSPNGGGAGTSTSHGAIVVPSTPLPARILAAGNLAYVNIPNGSRLYSVDVAAGSAASNLAAGGVGVAVYGVQVLRTENVGNVVWYTEVLSGAFGANTNFKVANGTNVIFVAAQRNHAVIGTAEGDWYVLTGIPGSGQETLRRVTGGHIVPPMTAPLSCIDLGDDLVWYLDPTNSYPAWFDGAKHDDLPYLSMHPADPLGTYAASTASRAANYRGAVGFQGADNSSPGFVIPAPNNTDPFKGRMLLMHNGAWTMHEFALPVSNLWTSDGRGRLFCVDQGATDTGLNIYTTQLRLDRPAFTSDAFASPSDSGANFTCEVEFPHIWSEDGEEVRVTEVMIDFVRWNTGSAQANNMDVDVTALARGSEVAQQTVTQSWTQPGSSSPATQAGTFDRVRLNFGHQGSGAGFAVKIRNMRGVAIRQVVVNPDPVKSDRRSWGA